MEEMCYEIRRAEACVMSLLPSRSYMTQQLTAHIKRRSHIKT